MTTTTTATASLFCVVYRMGGTDNFRWQRSLAMSRSEAEQARAEIERGGRKAMVVNYAQSMAIGLPDTYE